MSENKQPVQSERDAEKKTLKPSPKTPAQKKREREDFKRRYFDYYDDVKTNIKQDW